MSVSHVTGIWSCEKPQGLSLYYTSHTFNGVSFHNVEKSKAIILDPSMHCIITFCRFDPSILDIFGWAKQSVLLYLVYAAIPTAHRSRASEWPEHCAENPESDEKALTVRK